MAEISDLKAFLDAYGVAVRAGAVTPQMQDEEYVRALMDLPPMTDAVRAYWGEQDRVRKPLTIKTEEDEALQEAKIQNEENADE